MRLLISLTLFYSASAWAESYTCTYPAYIGNKPIIKKIEINGAKAMIDKYEYKVLQNTNLEIVLVRSFAEHNKSTKADDLGLFAEIINKKTMAYTRGNISDGDSSNSIAQGTCLKN